MILVDQTTHSLTDYVVAQIKTFVPDGRHDQSRDVIARHIDTALQRTAHCIDHIAMWRQGQFNYLHSSQYCIFLYYLANTIWTESGNTATPTRLFIVNKALNGIDLFYEIAMPSVFFIGHSAGIVLAKATYGEFLVLYQNATVGKSGGVAPVIGERVIIHPNCAVIGRANIADGTVLSQGTSVINCDTQPGMIAYASEGGGLTFKRPQRDMFADFFRSPAAS